MSEELKLPVEAFIRKPVPPFEFPSMDTWQHEARALGPGSFDLLINALRYGPEEFHFAAGMALKAQGHEVSQIGLYADTVYHVRRDREGELIIVKPIFNDKPF